MAALLTMLGVAQMASAGLITGYLYDNVFISSGDSTGAKAALTSFANGDNFGTPSDTFSVDKIDFTTNDTGNTYGDFLGGLSTGLSGLSTTYLEKAITTSSSTAAMIKFVGTAYFDDSFSIEHDDGIILKLEGITNPFDSSTPSQAITSNFTTTAGIYNFELYYQAWNGLPEVLKTNGVRPVPEPATTLLFSLGVAGLAGGVVRRKKK